MVAWVWPAVAFRDAPMVGRLGRYMSMAMGPKAVIDPSRMTSPQGTFSGEAAGEVFIRPF